MLFFISKHTKDYEKIGVATTDTVDTFPDLVSPQHLADKIGLYVPRRAVSNTLTSHGAIQSHSTDSKYTSFAL